MKMPISWRRGWSMSLFLLAAAMAWEGALGPPAALSQITFLNTWGSDQLAGPAGVAVDQNGNVYVADLNNSRIVIFNSTGTFKSTFGSTGTGNGKFTSPYGVAVGPTGDIYVADTANDRVQIFNSSGVFQSTFGSSGTGNGQFSDPISLTVDSIGNIYVADTANDRVQIFNPSGGYQTAITGLNHPEGVAVDQNGDVYVGNTFSNVVSDYLPFGSTYINGINISSGNGPFNGPEGVAVGPTGLIYVADTDNDRVEVFNNFGTFLTSFGSDGSGNSQFQFPMGIAIAPTGNLYVSDYQNNRIQRFFDPSSWVSGTNTFTNPAVGPTTFSVGGLGSLVDNSLTLNSSMGLVATTVDVGFGSPTPTGSLAVSGGSISVTNLNVDSAGSTLTESLGNISATSLTLSSGGQFNYQVGTHDIASMAVNSGTLTGGTYTVNPGETLTLFGGTISSSVLTIAPGGLVTESSGTFSSPTLNIAGTFSYSGGTLPATVYVDQGGLVSGGTLTIASADQIVGAGNVANAITNNGLIQPISGLLTFTGTVTNNGVITVSNGNEALFSNFPTNTGSIALAGGTLDTDGTALFNISQISGYGVLRTGGLTNTNGGTLSLAGSSSVFGPVTNGAGSLIHLSGTTPNVFFGTVANSGMLTVDAGGTGTLYAAYSGSGSILNNGTLFIGATSIAGKITGTGNLTLGQAGTPVNLSISTGGITDAQGGLTINVGSSLDLMNNALAINYGTAPDPAATIRSEIISGYNGGAWNGLGIYSSTAAAHSAYAVGYADGSVDTGTTAAPGQVLIKFTLIGDSNLDGTVNLTDLLALLNNYGESGRDWANGDFNYDGAVNLTDLLALLNNYGQSATLAETSFSGARVVPEPATVSLLALGLVPLLTRRRRADRRVPIRVRLP